MSQTTIDPTALDRQPGPRGVRRVPVVSVLHHSDLSLLGARHRLLPGRPVTVGRNGPEFELAGHRAAAVTLADPAISREQLRVGWSEQAGMFDIEPCASRRPVLLVDPAGAQRPIVRQTALPPGAMVAVGDRMVLHLGVEGRPENVARLGLVGESEAIWNVRATVEDVAQFNKPALILGETGAGKELVARAIHDASRRRGEFVAVNCAALARDLVEGTLFGYRKGAFTGAVQDNRGLFRAADQGTLFLDEFGELPLDVQSKLLRVLQEGSLTPVGEQREIPVDVRVVGATNRDIVADMAAGTLREDLYYRMTTHTVRVPPLRERPTDIPLLFAHFLGRHRRDRPELGWLWREAGGDPPPVPLDFVVQLLGHRWPGNVRELSSVAEQAVRLNLRTQAFVAPSLTAGRTAPARGSVTAPGPGPDIAGDAPGDELLELASQDLAIASGTVIKLLGPAPTLDPDRPSDSLRDQLTTALADQLDAHAYSQSRLASTLGVSRTTLLRLMKLLGFPRPSDLTAADIARARAEAGPDPVAMARLLRVSTRGLQTRLAELDPSPS